jgi:TolB-like protein
MINVNKVMILLVASLFLSVGCSSPTNSNNLKPAVNTKQVSKVEQVEPQYRSAILKKYANKLVDDVVGSLKPDVNIDKVAIATPVNVESLESTDWLGRELAEYFVSALHNKGFSVLEYKIKGWLEITPQGDYIYSRNWQKLASTARVSRILSGTMSHNDTGVMIYARLVNIKDAVVEGTAEIFIPYTDMPKCYRQMTGEINGCGVVINKTNAKQSQVKKKDDNTMVAEKTNHANANTSINVSKESSKVDVSSNKDTKLTSANTFVNKQENVNNATSASKNVNSNLKTHSSKNSKTKLASRNNKTKYTKSNTKTGVNTSSKFASYNAYKVDGTQAIGRGTYIGEYVKKCHYNCSDPVIYPATTTPHQGMLIRDVGVQSQYDRR